MKKLMGLAIGLCLASAVVAAPESTPVPLASMKWTNSAVITYTTPSLYGYLESIEIIPISNTGTYTNVIVAEVVTNYASQGRTILFTNSAITGSGLYRPRFAVHDNAGSAIGDNTNSYVRYLFCGDKLKVSGYSSSVTTNTVQMVFKLWQ